MIGNQFLEVPIIEISRQKDLLNSYYGARIDAEDIEIQSNLPGAFFCHADDNAPSYSLSVLAQEYPSAGASDFRSPAYEITNDKGMHTPELKYKSHELVKGKPKISGLPAVYTESDDEAETLIITAADEFYGLEVRLFYTVFEKLNVICRHAEVKNCGKSDMMLNNAQSVSLDFPAGEYEYIHLEGAWAREKHIDRNNVHKGIQGFESRRGASGHTENPFLMFFDKGTNEDYGNVYGISLVYSGNHRFIIEQEAYETVRVQAGINPFEFS
ncbi:MAG: glycoside hydrolase family 36 N-terminal domain-containing protein, partial [Ruminococcus bromii]|nr:glycoside hydrolase family 36 N-terminal domain-containing protein [Ruminococcus bromii]